MKNKGFTLIELLAVIVILAIIALIAVPIILNIINGSKKSSNERSVELYLNAVEQAIARKNLTGEFNPSTCTVKSDGNLTCDEVELIVEVKGTKPDSGTIKLEKVSVKKYELYIKGEKYTNIEYTPDSCFVVEDNGDGTATITGYICGEILPPPVPISNMETEDIWQHLDVVIPEEIEVRTIKTAKFNMDKCMTYAGNIGMTTEEATEQCNLTNEQFNSLSVEEIKTQIDSTPVLVQMFDIEYLPETKKLKVTGIGEKAFYYIKVTSVEIPNSVIYIEREAFSGSQLTSIEIPDSVMFIGECAFRSNKLTSVKIPDSVTSIEGYVFAENQLTDVEIPNSVTNIGFSAFYSNQLTSIEIPNSVTSIDGMAFYGNKLTSVEIPDSVTSIEYSAFESNSLTSVEIPNSVTSIEDRAFYRNPLTSVIIKAPKSQVTLDSSAFGDFDTANIEWQS